MGTLGAVFSHPDDFYPLLKLKRAVKNAAKQIPPEPHWAFCYTMLQKVSRSFALVIQQLDTDLRNAIKRLVAGTQEEAAEAYDIAAIKFRRLNAVTNFDMSRYDVNNILESSTLPIGGAAKRLKDVEQAHEMTLNGGGGGGQQTLSDDHDNLLTSNLNPYATSSSSSESG